jgi:hypothetical protein
MDNFSLISKTSAHLHTFLILNKITANPSPAYHFAPASIGKDLSNSLIKGYLLKIL